MASRKKQGPWGDNFPKADDPPSGHGGLGYLAVLQLHCHPDIRRDFESLPADAQRNCLLALKSTCEMLNIDTMVEEQFASLAAGGGPKAKTIKPHLTRAHLPKTTKLAPISARDMKLFQTAKGRVLQGTLVGDPICQVGITTILQDASGDIVTLGLYNQLPGGATGAQGQKLVDARFPVGTKVAIAEPFLKIFRSGGRGVRVDTPTDLKIISESQRSGTPQPSALHTALLEVQGCMKDKQHAAAFDACLAALQRSGEPGTEFAATVLSNKAQASLKMSQPAAALQQAAAALLLRPSLSKAWQRYGAAVSALGHPELALRAQAVFEATEQGADSTDLSTKSVCAVLDAALKCTPTAPEHADAGVGQTAVDLKTGANSLFREGKYAEAQELYAAALRKDAHAKDTAAMLCYLASSALSGNSPHTALAAAAAALHFASGVVHRSALRQLTKALIALGLIKLARRHSKSAAAGDAAWLAALQLDELGRCLAQGYTAQDLVGQDHIRDVVGWAGPVEVVQIEGKGRGLRTTRAVEALEILLVDAGLAKDLGGTLLMATQGGVVSTASQVALRSKLNGMCARDVLVCTDVRALDDGVRPSHDKPLPRISDMLQRFSPRVLPLLPQLSEYFPRCERETVSAPQVERMCTVNCHGEHPDAGGSSALYPAISLINHAALPNCTLLGGNPAGTIMARTGGYTSLMAVGAIRSLRKGQEITLQYLPDEAVVQSKWGIGTA